jgi:hypothetical protein
MGFFRMIWESIGLCCVNECMNGTDEWYVINVYINKCVNVWYIVNIKKKKKKNSKIKKLKIYKKRWNKKLK